MQAEQRPTIDPAGVLYIYIYIRAKDGRERESRKDRLLVCLFRDFSDNNRPFLFFSERLFLFFGGCAVLFFLVTIRGLLGHAINCFIGLIARVIAG